MALVLAATGCLRLRPPRRPISTARSTPVCARVPTTSPRSCGRPTRASARDTRRCSPSVARASPRCSTARQGRRYDAAARPEALACRRGARERSAPARPCSSHPPVGLVDEPLAPPRHAGRSRRISASSSSSARRSRAATRRFASLHDAAADRRARSRCCSPRSPATASPAAALRPVEAMRRAPRDLALDHGARLPVPPTRRRDRAGSARR